MKLGRYWPMTALGCLYWLLAIGALVLALYFLTK
jgi:hypothetical protein